MIKSSNIGSINDHKEYVPGTCGLANIIEGKRPVKELDF